MVIARVFPMKTMASPFDELVCYDKPSDSLPYFDEVHVSCAFTYDMIRAERLARQWSHTGRPVKLGGPAYNDRGGEFTPGLYLNLGYTITSRGCNNHCWFCDAWKREGKLRELEIKDGWNILDNNLLGCSENHIRKVFNMLLLQDRRPMFTGGLDSKLLKPWHVELLKSVRTQRMYFAYDTPDDLDPLIEAGKLLIGGGFNIASHILCCYVLIGYPDDTMTSAEKRLMQTINAGFVPFAMLYRDKDGIVNANWKRFQREWVRPSIIFSRLKGAQFA